MERKRDEDWDGSERRTIPFEIVNFVDDRIGEHTKEITGRLDTFEKQTQERHSLLIDKITAFTGECELVRSAFIKDESGKPDYVGHHYDHAKRKRSIEWWNGVKNRTFEKLVEWSSMAAIAWGAIQLWKSFLEGPP